MRKHSFFARNFSLNEFQALSLVNFFFFELTNGLDISNFPVSECKTVQRRCKIDAKIEIDRSESVLIASQSIKLPNSSTRAISSTDESFNFYDTTNRWLSICSPLENRIDKIYMRL